MNITEVKCFLYLSLTRTDTSEHLQRSAPGPTALLHN